MNQIELIKLKLEKNPKSLNDLIEIIKILRSPNGCDWDKEQTHKSLIPYLIEETYEVIDAINDNDYSLLKEELGDLLLHVLFQAEIANENNLFSIEDSIDRVSNKLINRHPHIFINKDDDSWTEGSWEKSKQKEKNRVSILDGVPKSMPSLLRARRIQEKAASVGFDWDSISPVFDKIKEEVQELEDAIKSSTNINEELGDVLFSVVNLSRHLNIDPELSLHNAINKFYSRFLKVEAIVNKENMNMKKMSLKEIDALWEKIKK